MLVRLSSFSERLRASLFFVPMAFVVVGVVLALGAILVDGTLLEGHERFLGLTATVDSARAVLQVVASATITFAGIAFSISLLVIQLASSQYSPRVVSSLFRDPFTKRVMGVVMATFTYCLVVLRAVQTEEDVAAGAANVPNLSVFLAVLFGIASILAIIAFIDHSAHKMDVSRILSDATQDARSTVRRLWPTHADAHEHPEDATAIDDDEDLLQVELADDGWVQRVDLAALASAADEGATVRLDIEVGRYAIAGTPLCTIQPVPRDEDRARSIARESVVVGESRTIEQDVGYGVRQLADVALRALSPSVNDPTTAQDALFHMGSVLREILHREPPDPLCRIDGRTVERSEQLDYTDLLDLAFDEVRLAARPHPTVAIYLLEIIHLLDRTIDPDERSEIHESLALHARLVRDGVDADLVATYDLDRVNEAWAERFGHD